MAGDERTKLVLLLKKLFQSDMADVDTGIYRIINRKRNEIEHFIEKDLIDAVDVEFGKYEQVNTVSIKNELDALRKQIEDEIAPGAIDANGNLLPQFASVRRAQQLAEQYRIKQATMKEAMLSLEHKNDVYNHIYQFFSRYYDSGDFMPLRRSSMKKKYSIPYNGEETLFYWANQDQYYIKTGEQFNNYTFKTGNYTIHFRLTVAETSTNNNKEADRYFLLASDESKNVVSYDSAKNELIILFEYRALTDAEKKELGKKATEDLILRNEKAILDAIDDFGLRNALTQKAAGEESTTLYKNLRKYTVANKSDYFIHKNLKGFLQRELDFFIKDEMLNIDDLGTENEIPVERYLARVKVFKAICNKVIYFLGQIEDFQRMLFEKKKFVLSTDYCITIDKVPEEFYPEISSNKAQIEEWQKLGFLEENSRQTKLGGTVGSVINAQYLKDNKFLVLDTKFFDHWFKDRLLSHFDDIDGRIDGLIIKSENFQALLLLQKRYNEQINCVHIDPPYNTATSGFPYKNDYKHSSWLTMMASRLQFAWSLLTFDGHLLCHIDENEYERLQILCEYLQFPSAGTIIWDKKNPMLGRKGIATQHEYILWCTRGEGSVYLKNSNQKMILEKAREVVKKYNGATELARREFARWIADCSELSGGEKAYHFIDNDGRVYQSASLAAPEPRTDPKFFIPLSHPITKKPCPVPPNGWSRSPETMQQLLAENVLIFGADETVQPRRKIFLTEESRRQVSSVIQDARRGKSDVDKLGLEFPYCHPVSLYVDLLGAAASDCNSNVIDFFAGSGTTGHAIIKLNSEDKGKRKFILVEIGEYCDTILLPRLKKVTFSPEWKDGKPVSGSIGQPNVFKYQILEQYDDTLENIEFIDSGTIQKTLYELDGYFLKYMLDYETKESTCRLNIIKLANPFNYTIWVKKNGVRVEQMVDLVETFNYLLGMHIKQLLSYKNEGVYYRVVHGLVDGKPVSVVWRSTKGFNEDKLRDDKAFIEGVIMNGRKPEKLYINGDFYVEGALPIEVDFKRLMGA